MRYQNWDILLFPEGSKIPVQEFKTQCFVTKDRDDPSFLANPAFYGNGIDNSHIPVLTTFVPSLTEGSPFRISIHSWDGAPKASRALECLMQVEDSIAFEARIYVDGLFVSGHVFAQHAAWPYVVDETAIFDRDGNPSPLKFPPFHQAILHQRHWDAAELLGRVRVVIAEGFARSRRSSHPFERFRDVIAWPNAQMWNGRRNLYGPNAPQQRQREGSDELHAHSPTKFRTQKNPNDTFKRPIGPEPQSAASTSRLTPGAAVWPCMDYLQDPRADLSDPFIGPSRSMRPPMAPHAGRRSTIEDTPMPDLPFAGSDRIKPRSTSSMTGVSYEVNPEDLTTSREPHQQLTSDSDVDKLINVFADLPSPSKQDPGYQVPMNTPATVMREAQPRVAGAGPSARAASYTPAGTVGAGGAVGPRSSRPASAASAGNRASRIGSAGSSRHDTPAIEEKENASPLLEPLDARNWKGGKGKMHRGTNSMSLDEEGESPADSALAGGGVSDTAEREGKGKKRVRSDKSEGGGVELKAEGGRGKNEAESGTPLRKVSRVAAEHGGGEEDWLEVP
ncbi:MAG: hypothetical protein Q9227_000402 [Pyrenula ochraceoflavens]